MAKGPKRATSVGAKPSPTPPEAGFGWKMSVVVASAAEETAAVPNEEFSNKNEELHRSQTAPSKAVGKGEGNRTLEGKVLCGPFREEEITLLSERDVFPYFVCRLQP